MRVVEQKIWSCQKWRKQIKDIKERYFWLYLLTCPSSKTCGIFYLPIDTMCFETNLTEEEIKSYIEHLKTLMMIKYNYDTEEILIFNYPRYNIIRLGKPMEDCLKSELSLIKDTSLIQVMVDYLESYIKIRLNDKKINILNNIINIYKLSISITITNESYNESCDEEIIDWDELMKKMENDD